MAQPELQRIRDLRRETNALYGLLSFADARRYPDGVVRGLHCMLDARTVELARLDDRAPAVGAGAG